MLYIHQLKDLTPKSSEIESVFIIRDIKKKTPYPLSDDQILNYFSLFYVSESEKNAMTNAVEQVEPLMTEIKELMMSKDAVYEPINLQRALSMLSEIPSPLMTNLKYAQGIAEWQQFFVEQFATLFNTIPRLRSEQEKELCNQHLNKIFEKLLRNDNLAFNYKDIVNEAHTARMSDLSESMDKGFFFHIYLEEELRKLSFNEIKSRIPDEKLRRVENLHMKVREIKKGVDAAYEVNLRMVNWALIVYSYIKWLKTV